MTEAELQALLEQWGVQNFGAPIGTSASGNLGLQEDIYSLIGNPIFQLQQGLVTPEEFQQSMMMLASAPVTDEEVDFATLEDNALLSGDDDLAQAYDLIKKGFTPDQVLRSLRDELSRATASSSADSAYLEDRRYIISRLENDLVEFKKRFDAANMVQEGLTTGEYFRGADGRFYRQLPAAEAREAYAAAGLPKGLQDPFLWRTVPDPELLAAAVKSGEKAKEMETEVNRLETVVGAQARKEGRRQGTAAYQEFLSRTPEGRRFLEEEQKKAAAKPGKSVGQQAKEAFLVGNIPVVGMPIAAAKALPKVVKGAAGAIKSASMSLPGRGRSIEDITRDVKAAQKAAENQAYWAKMDESYTARGAQEAARAPIVAAQKALEEQKARAATQLSSATQKGTIPAMQLIQKAGPIAAMLSQPAAKPRAARPAPRVLSDQEINAMANMIAGGII